MKGPPPVHAWIDEEDRFAAADPRIGALQHAAGGEVPGIICLPQIAGMARLVRQIGAPVRRRLMVADGFADIHLDVEARMDGAQVALSVLDWREHSASGIAGPSEGGSGRERAKEEQGAALPPVLDRAVRPPLARILADAEGLLAEGRDVLDATHIGYAEDILSASRHLEALIERASDFQAFEGQGLQASSGPIDLAAIAREAAAMAMPRSIEAGCEVLSSGVQDQCIALGDHQRALQVAGNLLSNAMRHAPAGSAVLIGTTLSERRAILWVADRGRGIDPADQARIFEKYQRVDPEEPGCGLGLYIARGLAEAMGGNIHVDSTPGEGAVFIFSLSRP